LIGVRNIVVAPVFEDNALGIVDLRGGYRIQIHPGHGIRNNRLFINKAIAGNASTASGAGRSQN
jgi:hypothetical protein